MRLLHVVSTTETRGAEIFASDLVKALDRAGNVTQHVAILRGVAGAGISYNAPVSHRVAHGPSLPRMDLRTVRWLSSCVRSFGPDVVQAHGGEALKYAIPAGWGWAPVIYRKIGLTPAWMAGRGRRAIYAHLIRRAAAVVAVGDHVADEAVSTFGVPPPRIAVIPNAVDPDRIRPSASRASTRRALGVAPNARLLLWVGALNEEKDPLEVVRLACELRSRGVETIVALVGDGPLRARTESAARADLLGPLLRVLRTRTDVPDLMVASDALVMTSRTEGMPACLIEAGMLGVPAAAYAVGGVPEIIVDAYSGLLSLPGDIAALSSGALRLLLDDDERGRLGRNARSSFRSRFDIRSIAPSYLELYRAAATRARVRIA